MQARTLKIIAALLIVSAVIMGIIGYRISQQDALRDQQRQTAASQADSYTYAQKLVITTRDIAKGEPLSEDALMQVPYAITVEGSYATVQSLLDKRSKQAIPKGAIVRRSDFEDNSTLAAQIQPGYRAVAVKVDEVIGTGGFLKPGDYVDVIFNSRASKETNNRSLARRVLRDIRLIAFGDEVEGQTTPQTTSSSKTATKDKDNGKRSRSAVLEVALADVNRLILAESSGSLRLVALGEADQLALQQSDDTEAELGEDKATVMREVTGFKPAPPPKSIYMYSGDKVETIRVRN